METLLFIGPMPVLSTGLLHEAKRVEARSVLINRARRHNDTEHTNQPGLLSQNSFTGKK